MSPNSSVLIWSPAIMARKLVLLIFLHTFLLASGRVDIGLSTNSCGGLAKSAQLSLTGCSKGSECIIDNNEIRGSLNFESAEFHRDLTLSVGTNSSGSYEMLAWKEVAPPDGVKPGTPTNLNFNLKLRREIDASMLDLIFTIADGSHVEVCLELNGVKFIAQSKQAFASGNTARKHSTKLKNTGQFGDPCEEYNMPCSFGHSNCLPASDGKFTCQCDFSTVREDGRCKRNEGGICESNSDCADGTVCRQYKQFGSYKFCVVTEEGAYCKAGAFPLSSSAIIMSFVLVLVKFVFL